MRSVVRALGELGADYVLAPERWLAAVDAGDGVPLAELVVERRERGDARALVLDTTHARDGLLDLPAAERAGGAVAKSQKRAAHAGDLVVSRLRPYLRQIGFVHPDAIGARKLALSTEFYVLAPKQTGESLAYLLPFLLGSHAQAMLASAQEGGHHPRVPRSSLFALRIPEARIRDRRRCSAEIEAALSAWYRASSAYQDLLTERCPPPRRRGKPGRSA